MVARSTFMLKINIQLSICKFIEMSKSNGEKNALKAMVVGKALSVSLTAFAFEIPKHEEKKNYAVDPPLNAIVWSMV